MVATGQAVLGKDSRQVLVMSQGKVTYSGTAVEIWDNPEALQEIYLLSDG